MIFVDASVWIDFYRRHDTPESARLTGLISEQSAEIVVGDLVLAEVLQG